MKEKVDEWWLAVWLIRAFVEEVEGRLGEWEYVNEKKSG